MGVPQNGKTWMFYFTKVRLIKIDDIWIWGTTIYGNSHVLP
jgi:hypothetical protein